MFTRKAVTASAAAVALIALSVPAAQAQDDGSATVGSAPGSLSLASLEGGSLDAGSLTGGSDESPDGGEDGAGGDGADADPGSLEGGSLGSFDSGSPDSGSLDSGSADDSSLGDLVPETDSVCELPDLGGSVAKFYPLFGIDGVPTGVLDLITSALDSFPNLLDVVAGEGRGAALIGEAGSLSEGLCTFIFGGEMVMPPVTVIVDGDGTPVTTVTGAATTSSGASTSATTSAASSAASSATASGAAGDGAGEDIDGAGSDAGAGELALPTSVPVPGV